MGNRSSFRPTLSETLEERVVMSHSAVHALAHPVANVQNTPSRLGPIGALGDSYTDEYRFYAPDRTQARNWVEMLHTLRGVSFGPYTTQSRGEPRDQGFAYNWARSGATSTDMVNSELSGLTAQVKAGLIRYASIFIGGNDYLNVLNGAVAGLIPPANIPATLLSTQVNLETNYATAVNTLLNTNPNVRLVVWTLPPVSIVPSAVQAAASSPQAKALLQEIDQLILQFNDFIKGLAATSDRIAVLDLAAVTASAAGSTTGTITFGGLPISLTTASDDYLSFFLADGIHIGTVGQGIVADAFAETIDQKFGAQLFPITPTEIINYAAKVAQKGALASSSNYP